jgi:CreA protein
VSGRKHGTVGHSWMRLGIAGAAILASAAAAAAIGDGKGDRAAALGYAGSMVCYVRVADVEKALAWYEDVLGLELLSRNEAIGWCELQSPAKDLAIGLLEQPKPKALPGAVSTAAASSAQSGATIVFGVKDLDATRRVLESRGVKFQGPTMAHEGYVKLAGFFDPDGNLYTLSQSLAAETGKQ